MIDSESIDSTLHVEYAQGDQLIGPLARPIAYQQFGMCLRDPLERSDAQNELPDTFIAGQFTPGQGIVRVKRRFSAMVLTVARNS
jgi:hypothetical protein